MTFATFCLIWSMRRLLRNYTSGRLVYEMIRNYSCDGETVVPPESRRMWGRLHHDSVELCTAHSRLSLSQAMSHRRSNEEASSGGLVARAARELSRRPANRASRRAAVTTFDDTGIDDAAAPRRRTGKVRAFLRAALRDSGRLRGEDHAALRDDGRIAVDSAFGAGM